MTSNTKTPAMVLQELTIRSALPPPEYILERSQTGQQYNEFHYLVNVAGVACRGFGRSKQVAKHAAAMEALRTLASKGTYDLSTCPLPEFNVQNHRNEAPNPDQVPMNFVGDLKTKCFEFKLHEPIFEEISDVGPPHCRAFTYTCKINSMMTQATANTKKQAKQLSAKEMLEKVNNICPDTVVGVQMEAITDTSHEEIIKTYKILMEADEVIPNRGINVDEFTYTFKKIMNTRGLKFDDFNEFFEMNSQKGLDRIMDMLDLKYQINAFGTDFKLVSLSIRIDTPFTIVGVGDTTEEAVNNAIIDTLDALQVYMKADHNGSYLEF